MSNIDPPAGWDDVDGINTNERLLGGPNGPLNRGLVGLTARTKQLRADQTAAAEALADPPGSTLVGYQLAAVGSVPRTDYAKNAEWITPEDFGAVGDGVTNDSAAINIALSVPGRVVRFMPKSYLCGDIVPAAGVHLLGFSGHGYTADEESNRPRLLRAPGTSCILNLSGVRGVSATGVLFDGADSTVPLVSSGSTRFSATNCRFIRGSIGLGGQVGGGNSYTRVAHLIKCVFASNGRGVQNLIDSFATESEFANNGLNIYGVAGANSNVFVGCRMEWASTSNNLRLTGDATTSVSSYQFVGCLFDRGNTASISLAYANSIQFVGCRIRRANRSASTAAADDCNVYATNSDNISFTDCIHSAGVDDNPDPGAVATPNYAYSFGSSCTNISIVGGAQAGTFAGAFTRGADTVAGFKQVGVSAVADRITSTVGVQINNGQVFRSAAFSNIATTASAVQSLTTRRTVSTFSTALMTLSVTTRDATTGTARAAEFFVQISRGGGTPSLTATKKAESGTAGYIAVGGGTISLAFSNIGASGESFDVTVTNNDVNTAGVTCTLV